MHACVYICVCFYTYTGTHEDLPIHMWKRWDKPEEEKEKKTEDTENINVNQCFYYSTRFIILPHRVVLYLNYSFTFYSQIFTKHQTLARHNVFLNLYRKTNFKNVSQSLFRREKGGREGLSSEHLHRDEK